MSISYGGDYITDTDGGILKPSSSVMRNRIINGAMVIDQRNAGASVTPANAQYTIDRWAVNASITGKFTVQQNAGSITPPTGFSNYIGLTSTSAYTVGSSESYAIYQAIEGYNVADLGFGSANAKTVTLSFWVRSSLTGLFGGVLTNNGYVRTYPFTYTISSANTWQQINITIAGDTSGTWLTTNGTGIIAYFSIGTGSAYQGTANTWSGTTYLAPTGQTSVVGTSGATFFLTGIQLEVGSSATGFEYRQYTTELQLCQRYYQKFGGIATMDIYADTYTYNGVYATYTLPVEMRATPTGTITGTYSTVNLNGGQPVVAGISQKNITIGKDISSGGRAYFFSNNSGGFTLSSEL